MEVKINIYKKNKILKIGVIYLTNYSTVNFSNNTIANSSS